MLYESSYSILGTMWLTRSAFTGDGARVHVSHLERCGFLRVLRYVSVDDLSHHQDQANDGQNEWNHFI